MDEQRRPCGCRKPILAGQMPSLAEPQTSLAVAEKLVVAHGAAAVGPLSLLNTEKTAWLKSPSG